VKKVISLGVVSLFIGLLATLLLGNQTPAANTSMQGQFTGGWRLISLEQEGPDKKIQKTDATGLLVFTPDGHMSVQVMERNVPAQTSPGPVQYAQGGYEASFGTCKINEQMHKFTFHVEGALVRTLVGKDLPRSFEFSGKQLIVKSTNPKEHWRVVWERY
jgi:Lipocalin-like domain